jgi:hypothetical protein
MRGQLITALACISVLTCFAPQHCGWAQDAVDSGPATPAGAVGDPLAYTQTGDALWDAYAQALLAWLRDPANREIPAVDADADHMFVQLPAGLLLAWEPQFGSDPRYWQLLYWNSIGAAGSDSTSAAAGITYLYEVRRRGIEDAATAWLLAEAEIATLRKAWTAYEEGAMSAEQLAEWPKLARPQLFNWHLDQLSAIYADLTARFPDESYFWYERAFDKFDLGEWESGLEDLETGTLAMHNRLPLSFPASFLTARMMRGEDCGNTVAVGMALERFLIADLPNYISIKEDIKNQTVRFSLGADPAERIAWHDFAYRFGTMEGAPSVQWIVSAVLQGMLTSHFLIDQPDALSRDERREVWVANQRARQVMPLVKYELAEENLNTLVLQPEMLQNLSLNVAANEQPTERALKEAMVGYYDHIGTNFVREYGSVYPLVLVQFDKMQSALRGEDSEL